MSPAGTVHRFTMRSDAASTTASVDSRLDWSCSGVSHSRTASNEPFGDGTTAATCRLSVHPRVRSSLDPSVQEPEPLGLPVLPEDTRVVPFPFPPLVLLGGWVG